MNSCTSKHKLITGELINARWHDFKLNEIGTEGNLFSANGLFVAASWQSAKSCIAVFDVNNPHRVTSEIPLIRINLDPINDLKFSPYSTHLLASSGDDGTVKLWTIPKDGLTSDIEQETQIYTGHVRKVNFSQFHPCSSDVCASASADNTLQAWNILTSKTYSKVQLNDAPYCIEWNRNGSLLGTVAKDKIAYIVDPRTNKVSISAKTHESSKAQKMCFCEETYFASVGFNKSDREIKLYDMRKVTGSSIDSAVQTLELDKQRGVMSMQYDEDMKMIIIPSRGECVINFVDVSSNQLFKLNEYKQNVPPRSFSFLEKRFVDYNKNEMQRMYRYIENTLEILSLPVPRKSKGYDISLYPNTFNGVSALSGEEWASGIDKERNREPIDKIESVNPEMNIVKKKSEVIQENLEEKVVRLEKEIVNLKQKLDDKEAINVQLRSEVDRLKDLLSKAKA